MKHLFNLKKGLSLLIILTISSGAFSQWITVGNADFSVGGAAYTKLIFNSTGVPYIAYNDYSEGGKV